MNPPADHVPRPRTPPRGAQPGSALRAAAADLTAGLTQRPWGQMTPSVYESARLVSLAPWLTGHGDRTQFLIDAQNPDGTWGGPDAYAVVPTLSATEALLHELVRGGGTGATHAATLAAAITGAQALSGLVGTTDALPDTPAIELIIPALTAMVDARLAALRDSGRLGCVIPAVMFARASNMDGQLLGQVRALVRDGARIPDKLLHSLEVLGPAARRATGVRPVQPGTVGASPAATAAWVGAPEVHNGHMAESHLRAVASQVGGPVPSVLPITMFERAWVVTTLRRANLMPPVPHEVWRSLLEPLGPDGTPGGAGLPPDADTTSVVLLALAQHGIAREPECLRPYETDTHFCTWAGERTPSTTTNAHVLETLAYYAGGAGVPPRPPRDWINSAMAKASRWLVETQTADGPWVDKWHASAYYATATSTIALSQVGLPEARRGIARAVAWVVDSQRADGSWGRWSGTIEETAYALHALLASRHAVATDHAVRRGYAFLLDSIGRVDDPPLWHDKDLYRPVAVATATTLAALALVAHAPAVRHAVTESFADTTERLSNAVRRC